MQVWGGEFFDGKALEVMTKAGEVSSVTYGGVELRVLETMTLEEYERRCEEED